MNLLLFLILSIAQAASKTSVKGPLNTTKYEVLTAPACMEKNFYKFCTPPDDEPLNKTKFAGFCCPPLANNTECKSDFLCTAPRQTKDLSEPQ
jgi:hypothetical protein